jgi:hypothetical protein
MRKLAIGLDVSWGLRRSKGIDMSEILNKKKKGGKFSRSKGIRNELKLRDEFRKLGYESRRIPLSGASEGFKGDVLFAKEGVTLVAELKTRQKSFTALYAYLLKYCKDTEGLILGECPVTANLAVMSYNLGQVLNYESGFQCSKDKDCVRAIRKLNTLKKVVGHADILVVKDDRKPFIYIRYWEGRK